MPEGHQPIAIRLKRLSADARIPQYEYPDDSGADLYAAEDAVLQPGERRAIATGLVAEVPLGYEIQVRPKSGLALKSGITVLNTPGTVDAGYRGEIKVILINLSAEPYAIHKGQKIAQLVVAPVFQAAFEEVAELSESRRGAGGFGSTGLQPKRDT
jgi:dUTP pyrophosphatase